MANAIASARANAANTTVTTEHPATYNSQSNGRADTCVWIVRGMFRTLKLCIGGRISTIIPINRAVIPWLLDDTCMLLNTRSRGVGGRTAWQRCRGRNSQMFQDSPKQYCPNCPRKARWQTNKGTWEPGGETKACSSDGTDHPMFTW